LGIAAEEGREYIRPTYIKKRKRWADADDVYA